MSILLHKACLVKWSSRGEGVKNVQNSVYMIYGRPLEDDENEFVKIWCFLMKTLFRVECQKNFEFSKIYLFYFSNNQRQVETKEVVDKLRYEEDKLRREQLEMTSASDDPNADKERMILMQQKKIAALDAANKR